MILQELNPATLQPNPWNSNKVAKNEFAKLKQSLTTYGAFKPIVVRELPDGTLQIIGGYHRNEAAKDLGWSKVPVVNLGPISDEKAKEIGLIDNTRYGEDDKELLEAILEEIGDMSAILPELDIIEIDMEDSLLEEVEREVEAKEPDETHKTIKLKFEIDKAEEIEAILSKVAYDHDYKYSDGHSNFADALYHILVLERS
jgi:ParB family chromosome partitioning protein